MVADSAVFVLIGPGGVGKGTIARELIARDPHLWLSRSWTTRAQRPSEKGSEYVFVSREAFEEHVANEGFYEWAEFHGNLYGTPLPTPPEGDDVLLEIEVQGAEQVKARHPHATVILVLPPSDEELRARLQGRGDSDDHVSLRMDSSSLEIARGRKIADHVLVNEEIPKIVDEIVGILNNVRRSR